MKRRKKFVASVIISFFLSASLFCQDIEGEKPNSDSEKFTSLHKSLILPGWGQIAEKRYIEGALFLCCEIFCLYKIFSYNHKGNDYYSKYKDANNVEDATKFRELTEKYDTRRNKFILIAAGIWAVNLIDIYVILKGKRTKQSNLKIKINAFENQKLVFAISYSF